MMDVVGLLVDDLQSRADSASHDERIARFRRLQADIDQIKSRAAERRLARIAADLELLQRTDEPAYHQLRAHLRDLVRD